MTDTTNSDNAATPNSDTTAVTEGNNTVVEAASSSEATPESTSSPITKADLDAALTSARQQEKSKLYKKLEHSAAENEELQKTLTDRDSLLTELQNKLNVLNDSSLSEQEKIQKQLQVLEERNGALQEQLEKVAEISAARIHESELRAYRSQQLRESGLTLTELVQGSSQEEIDTSIANALQREQEIFNRASTEVEQRLRAENKTNVPTPVAPSAPRASTSMLSGLDRSSVAKLDAADYSKIRSKLMEEAKRTAGLG